LPDPEISATPAKSRVSRRMMSVVAPAEGGSLISVAAIFKRGKTVFFSGFSELPALKKTASF
jgi:hypothetical protein